MSQQPPKREQMPQAPAVPRTPSPNPVKTELQKIQRQLHHLTDRVKGLQEKV